MNTVQMRSSVPPRLLLPTLTLAGLLVAWLVLVNFLGRSYIEDDAFIHLEYARSVARGQGFAFNGHVSYGDTSPAWVAFLAIVQPLVGDWQLTAKVLAVTTAIFSLAIVGWFGTLPLRESPPDGAPFDRRAAFLVVCLGLATNPYFAFWSTSGMEAVAAGGCILLAVHLCFAATRPASRAIGFLLAGALPLLRPESILILPVIAVARGFMLWRRSLRGSGLAGPGIAQWMGECALMAVPVLCWCVYAFGAFGTVEPNTNAAKRVVGGQGSVVRMLSVYAVGFGIAAAGLAAAWWLGCSTAHAIDTAASQPRQEPATAWIPFAVVCTATIAIQMFYAINNTAVQTRYALVWGTIAYACIVHELCRAYRSGLWRPVRSVIAASVVVQAAFTALVTLPYLAAKADAVLAQRTAYAEAVKLVPPEAPIAIYAIGQFAFETEHPIVDTGGITDVDVVRHFGNTGATLAWAHDRGAKYYLGGTASAGRELGRWHVISARWSLDPRKASLPDTLLLTTLDVTD